MSRDPVNSEEISRFEDQFRRNPDSLVFARLADAHRKAGDPSRALEILEAGIVRHGSYPSAHIVCARTYMDLGRTGAAEQSFLKAIELDGSNLVAMRGLASLARERGDEAGARLWFQRISGLGPETSDAGQRLPPTEESWWTPDEPDSADEPADAWWFEDPADAGSSDDGDLLTRTMAELYEKQGLIEEAMAIYKELLEDRPDDAELTAALARAETRFVAAPRESPSSPDPSTVPVAKSAGTSAQSEVFLNWLRSLGE